MRWIGIDEAGYGPNLGPLVMAAVIAEGPDDRPPDLWADRAATVCRAGGGDDLLWVEDSKAILRGARGRDRLEEAAIATLHAAGAPGMPPEGLVSWLSAVGAGSLQDVELAPWIEPGADPPALGAAGRERLARSLPREPLGGDGWRIVGVRAEVVGPSRFNADLEATGSKAAAHFRTFARLLAPLWADAHEPTRICADKHGGRHFYLGPLSDCCPDAWIDRGEEGPDLSRYTLRDPSRRLEVCFRPRADAGDGLVALASIAAKGLREAWMGCFNAFWLARLQGLKPTAGYPNDALRFRRAIEEHARTLGFEPRHWWRDR